MTAFRRVSINWPSRGLPNAKERTIRNWISALENIERIEDDTSDEYVDYVRRLRTVPVAAAELVARWHRYDALKALKAARVIVGGRWSVEQLREAEKNARAKNAGYARGRQYAHRLEGQVRKWATLHLTPDFKRLEKPPSDDPADILFVRENDPNALAAVVIFGPYSYAREYDSRLGSFMGIVAGLAAYCERVLAIVPDESIRYWRWLHQRKLEGAGIEFFAVHHRGKDFDPLEISRPSATELVSSEDEG
ncbi:hypothetical protein Nham_4006 [Nitrobacter hamburgensis X14]|uniref:Uncharacterized protein n=1 Tax=Nitrobacter hamburgensis (strain DSM 10229 / NCIMB 13809 / X14) TaxID=323097 RepID=Q1QGH2_NITHX|nr:hypothetical protein Nham_4006 [Nitrobacter hamburgensis X14]